MWIRTARDLGLAIRERRRAIGLSQATLAERLGTSRQWIITLEKGRPGVGVGLVLRATEALALTLHLEPRETASAATPESAIDLDAILARARGSKETT